MLLCCEYLRRNILPEMSTTYLKSCHRGNDSLCPIFRLGDMVREAGENFHEMAVEVRSPDFKLHYQDKGNTWSPSVDSGLKE